MTEERPLSMLLVTGLLVLSIAVFFWTEGMTPGAELFPRIVAGALASFAVIELVRYGISVRQSMRDADPAGQANLDMKAVEEREHQQFLRSKSTIHMGVFFLMVVAFVWSYPLMGFEVMAILFMGGGMLLLGGRKAIRAWLAAVLIPLGIVVIFRFGLNVSLPTLPFLN